MSEIYAITDIDGYVSEMRLAVAKSIAQNGEKENLDEYISLAQMKSLVNDWCVGYDDQDRPILDEDANQNIFQDMRTWITNVGLAKLAAEGSVECAWDNETNDMIFWVNDPKVQNDDKPRKNKRTKRKDK